MRPSPFLLLILAVAPLTRVTAQDPLPIKVGDLVRVTAPALGLRTQLGTVVGMPPDSLVLGELPPGHTVAELRIPLASLTWLRVERVRHSRATKVGAVTGFVVGGATGAVIGAIHKACIPTFDTAIGCEDSPAFGAVLYGLAGAAVGAGLGVIVGALIKTKRWEDVPLDQLRVSFVPQRDGRFGLGLSVRF